MTESICLIVDDATAIIVELVTPKGGVLQGEKAIMRTLPVRP